MQQARNSPSDPRQWVAGGPVGYKDRMRDGAQERTGTRGRGAQVGQKPRTTIRGQGRRRRLEHGHKREDRSGPCQGHETAPGWMRIQ